MVTWDNGDVTINEDPLGRNEDVFTNIEVTGTENAGYGRSLADNW